MRDIFLSRKVMDSHGSKEEKQPQSSGEVENEE